MDFSGESNAGLAALILRLAAPLNGHAPAPADGGDRARALLDDGIAELARRLRDIRSFEDPDLKPIIRVLQTSKADICKPAEVAVALRRLPVPALAAASVHRAPVNSRKFRL